MVKFGLFFLIISNIDLQATYFHFTQEQIFKVTADQVHEGGVDLSQVIADAIEITPEASMKIVRIKNFPAQTKCVIADVFMLLQLEYRLQNITHLYIKDAVSSIIPSQFFNSTVKHDQKALEEELFSQVKTVAYKETFIDSELPDSQLPEHAKSESVAMEGSQHSHALSQQESFFGIFGKEPSRISPRLCLEKLGSGSSQWSRGLHTNESDSNPLGSPSAFSDEAKFESSMTNDQDHVVQQTDHFSKSQEVEEIVKSFALEQVIIDMPILRKIEDKFLTNVTTLSSLEFLHPESINFIGNDFLANTGMKEIRYKFHALNFIGDNAFADCNKTETINLQSDTLQHIGTNFAQGNQKMQRIYFILKTLSTLPTDFISNLPALKTFGICAYKVLNLSQGFLVGCVNLESAHIHVSSVSSIAFPLLIDALHLKSVNFNACELQSIDAPFLPNFKGRKSKSQEQFVLKMVAPKLNYESKRELENRLKVTII